MMYSHNGGLFMVSQPIDGKPAGITYRACAIAHGFNVSQVERLLLGGHRR
jgi:hypothetical protein